MRRLKGVGRRLTGRPGVTPPTEPTIDSDISDPGASEAFGTVQAVPEGSGNRLQGIKRFFELAKEGLGGIGIPGVEAIAGIPLLIIRYCEVRKSITLMFSCRMMLTLRNVTQETKADEDTLADLVASLQALAAILEQSKQANSATSPNELMARIAKLET